MSTDTRPSAATRECPACNGKGYTGGYDAEHGEFQEDDCVMCGGRGYVPAKESRSGN